MTRRDLTPGAPLAVLLAVAGLAAGVSADTPQPAPASPEPRPYWGDLHVHTRYSTDAATAGNFDLGPDIAFRLARGEAVVASNGRTVRLARPLDFLAVTDHAETMGLVPHLLQQPNPPRARNGRLQLQGGYPRQMLSQIARSSWQLMIKTADYHDAPGKFTAFAAYEWTATPGGDGLHRVVLFEDGIDKLRKTAPISSFLAGTPALLWQLLARYEESTGGGVISIPHGANLSNGLMFAVETPEGERASREWAELRARFEPVVEVTQMRGDAETHPSLSPEDEFADFETWDTANHAGSVPKQPEMLETEYARSALQLGLRVQTEVGINPFRFGMVGGTGSHTSLSTPEEDAFFGSSAQAAPSATRWSKPVVVSRVSPALSTLGWRQAAAGLTAIWAERNTREALFAGLRRREVYATTGPRIRVRVFAGWGFQRSDLDRSDLAAHGAATGVAMGSVLPDRPPSGVPRLLIRAASDPDGAHLDRVQVVKGWVTPDGRRHEKLYDVALSDGRAPGRDGRATAVGSTVNIGEATFENTIGAPRLDAFWRDPAFDPKVPAFYYVRVLEIPTPRWSTYDAKRFGAELAPEIPRTLQERAYTSPVWYTP